MLFKKSLISLTFILILWAVGARGLEQDDFFDSPPIRVLVFSGAKSIRVESPLPYLLYFNGKVNHISEDKVVDINPLNEKEVKMTFGELIQETKEVKFKAYSPDGVFYVNGRRFRGEIIVFSSGKERINVVNTISIEQYLYSVVAKEMGGGGLEAQKAQAVVARTFAVSKIVNRRKAIFDLDATSLSQVYGGLDGERRQAALAVDDTRGEVLSYRGKIVKDPLYHSTCGGATANNEEVFIGGVPRPYLRGLPDILDYDSEENEPFCKTSPLFEWRVKFERELLNSAIKRHNMKGVFNKINITKTGPNGRVMELFLVTTEALYKLEGEKIRLFFQVEDSAGRTTILPSTQFVLESNDDGTMEIMGKGYGHGVGMCQWGAIEMARRGKEYSEILRKYYINTDVLDDYGGVFKY